MASVPVTADSTAYVAVTSADALIQNVSAYPLRWISDTTLPSPSDINYHTLEAGQAFLKSGNLPLGTIYIRAEFAGKDVKVIYSV